MISNRSNASSRTTTADSIFLSIGDSTLSGVPTGARRAFAARQIATRRARARAVRLVLEAVVAAVMLSARDRPWCTESLSEIRAGSAAASEGPRVFSTSSRKANVVVAHSLAVAPGGEWISVLAESCWSWSMSFCGCGQWSGTVIAAADGTVRGSTTGLDGSSSSGRPRPSSRWLPRKRSRIRLPRVKTW